MFDFLGAGWSNFGRPNTGGGVDTDRLRESLAICSANVLGAEYGDEDGKPLFVELATAPTRVDISSSCCCFACSTSMDEGDFFLLSTGTAHKKLDFGNPNSYSSIDLLALALLTGFFSSAGLSKIAKSSSVIRSLKVLTKKHHLQQFIQDHPEECQLLEGHFFVVSPAMS